MTDQSLYEALYAKEKIRELLVDVEKEKILKEKNVIPDNSRIEELEKKLSKVKNQKDKLIRQLSETELDKSDAVSLYNRILLSLVEMFKNDLNRSLHGTVDEFKKVIKKGGYGEILDLSFQKLKNAVLSGNITDTEHSQEKSRSKFSLKKLIGADDTGINLKEFKSTYLKYFKDTYQDIINELCLELGEDAIQRLVRLSKKVHVAEHPDEFDSLRSEILVVLQEYIRTVSSEREKAARLISNVCRWLNSILRNPGNL